MSTPAYARILVSRNGGASQIGGITAAYSDVIQLTGESTTGWYQQRWEIMYFPVGYGTPSGWTLDSTTGFLFSTAVVPPPFTLPASVTWGKWIPRLRVNEAITNDSAAGSLTDISTAIEIVSDHGLHDLGAFESVQFDRDWTRDHQANLRIIDPLLGGGGGGPPTGAAGGDLGGNYPNPNVMKIRGAAVGTGAGGLVTGTVLRVTGASDVDWGAVNLANSAAVTGLLPIANIAPGTNGHVLQTAAGVASWALLSASASLSPGGADKVLVTNTANTAVAWVTQTGDVTGKVDANTVVALTGSANVVDAKKTKLKWTQDTILGQDRFLEYQPTEANAPAWIVGRGEFSYAGVTRHNQVWTMGWNLSPGVGGAVVAGECAMGLGFESRYEPVNGGIINDMEHHLYFVTSDGVQHRPMSWLFRRTDGTVEGTFAGNNLRFSKEIGTQSCFWIQPSNTLGAGIALAGAPGQTFTYLANFNNGIAFSQMNAAQDAYIPLFYLDNANVFQLAPTGIATKISGSLTVGNLTAGGFVSATVTTGVLTVSSTIPAGSVAPGTNGQVYVTAGGVSAWNTPGGDWLGPVATNTVVGLTGTAGVVASHATVINADASLELKANTGANRTIDITVGGSTPTGIRLNADNIYFRQGGATPKGNWSNTGLKIGDDGATSHVLETTGIAKIGTRLGIRVDADANNQLRIDSFGGQAYSQVRITAGGLGGISIHAHAVDNAFVVFDADYSNDLFVARHTSGTMLRKTGAKLVFYGDTGLVSGNTFTPTARAELTLSSGLWRLNAYASGIAHFDASGNITSSAIVDADITSATITAAKLNAGGTANRVLLTTDGTNATWGQVNLGTAQVTGTLPAGNQAAQTMGGDVTGTTAANTVVALTGTASLVSIPAATSLRWDTTLGPIIGDASNDLSLKVQTANASIKFFDTTNLIAFLNYNSGSPYLQQYNGAGFQLISTNGDMVVQSVTASTGVLIKAGGSSVNATFTATGLRLGDASVPTERLDVIGNAKISAILTANEAGTDIVLRAWTSSSSYGAIYMGVTPGNTNYSFISNGTSTQVNAPDGAGTLFFCHGDSIAGNWKSAGLRIGDTLGATDKLEVKGNLAFDVGTTCKVYQPAATSGNGRDLLVLAQDGFQTSGNNNGGNAVVQGGKNRASGFNGGVQLKLGAGANDVMLQVMEVATSVRIVGICTTVALTTSDLSTGANVAFWKETAGAPTTNPTGGVAMWVDTGRLTHRNANAVITALAPS